MPLQRGLGGRQNHGMSVCLMGTVDWDRCLSRETLGQLLSPTRHAAGGEPWFTGKIVVCQFFASILTRLQLDSLQSDAAIASLTCHGGGGAIPGFGSLELPLDG